MILPRGSIMTISNVPGGGSLTGTLTEHGRSTLDLSAERIGSTERMLNGTMRSAFVAKKYSISVSWSDLPSADTALADYSAGAKGGRWIKDFYDTDASQNEVLVTLQYDGYDLSLNMLITSFSYEVQKRTTNPGYYDLVAVSLSLEEI